MPSLDWVENKIKQADQVLQKKVKESALLIRAFSGEITLKPQQTKIGRMYYEVSCKSDIINLLTKTKVATKSSQKLKQAREIVSQDPICQNVTYEKPEPIKYNVSEDQSSVVLQWWTWQLWNRTLSAIQVTFTVFSNQMPVTRGVMKEEIKRLLDLGFTNEEICEELGVGRSTVTRVKRFMKLQNIKHYQEN